MENALGGVEVGVLVSLGAMGSKMVFMALVVAIAIRFANCNLEGTFSRFTVLLSSFT